MEILALVFFLILRFVLSFFCWFQPPRRVLATFVPGMRRFPHQKQKHSSLPRPLLYVSKDRGRASFLLRVRNEAKFVVDPTTFHASRRVLSQDRDTISTGERKASTSWNLIASFEWNGQKHGLRKDGRSFERGSRLHSIFRCYETQRTVGKIGHRRWLLGIHRCTLLCRHLFVACRS